MRTKVATCLLLCVLAAGLVSATTLESSRLPSFLEFVSNVPAHVATARPDLYKDTLVAITPNKELKRGAYIEAYLTLSGTVRAAVDEEYRQIMKALKVLRPPKVVPKPAPVIRNKFGVIISTPPAYQLGAKILPGTTTSKTNAQKKASWRVVTPAEQSQVDAGIALEKAKRTAAIYANHADAAEAAEALKRLQTPRPKQTLAEKVAAWSKLSSKEKVASKIRAYFRGKWTRATVRKGVLAWKRLLYHQKRALTKKYPADVVPK